jgi:hypothetical protein
MTGKEVGVSAFGTKKGTGKMGVHLWYHNIDEYKKLSKEQKDELCKWRTKSGHGKGKGDEGSKKRPREAFDQEKAITSAVMKQVTEKMKDVKQAKTNGDEAEAYIMSIFKKYARKVSISDVTADTPTHVLSSLKSIIKRAKNAKSH